MNSALDNTDETMVDDDTPMQMVDDNGGTSISNLADDEAPAFVGDDDDVVEVLVDDENVPMEDDDEDDDDEDMEGRQQEGKPEAVAEASMAADMAQLVIASHTGPVYAVASALRENRLRIVSGGGDDKTFWHDVPLSGTSNQQKHVITTPLESHYHFKDSVSAVASNASFIGFAVDGADRNAAAATDATNNLQPPAAPGNPEWVAVGGLDGSVALFGPENQNGSGSSEGATAVRMQQLEGPTSDIEWLCWHPKGGNVLLVGSSDATIWMYHTGNGIGNAKCLQVFVGHEDAVTCGAFSANGKVALSGSADGTLRVWAPKTGKSKHVFRFASAGSSSGPAALTCMATHGGTDGHLVMVGAEDGQAHVCHVANKKHVTSLRHFDPALHLSSNANSGNGNSQDDEEEGVSVPSGVEAVGFSKSNPSWCATGGMDGVLRIWDLATNGQCRHVCRANVPSNQQLIPQQQEQQPPQSPVADGITQLRWHPSLPLVITSTCGGKVHVWDARNGNLLHTLMGHSDVINHMDVAFAPPAATDGTGGGQAMVVTGSDDTTVRIFVVDFDSLPT